MFQDTIPSIKTNLNRDTLCFTSQKDELQLYDLRPLIIFFCLAPLLTWRITGGGATSVLPSHREHGRGGDRTKPSLMNVLNAIRGRFGGS